MWNQRNHPERHQRRDDVSQDENGEENEHAEPVRDDPSVAEHEAGGDAKGHANQPRHGGEQEIAEEQAVIRRAKNSQPIDSWRRRAARGHP